MSKTRVLVSAAANIALVKYWGKQAGHKNEPATGSLSIGLEDLRTQTTLELCQANSDLIDFDGPPAGKQRITTYLDWIRWKFGLSHHFIVKSLILIP